MTARRNQVADKREMRERVLARRRDLSPQQRHAGGEAIAAHLLQTPEIGNARTVAAYVSVGTEPPTTDLLETLRRSEVGVLLPVLLPDLDLAWAEYAGPQSLEHGPRGIAQPAGPRLGVDAVTVVDAVICPGLAVDPTGLRLGRGGGSYDRALARIDAATWSCVLLYDQEVLTRALPSDPHDRRVHAATTPGGVHRFAG